jgi:hypothetical protein
MKSVAILHLNKAILKLQLLQSVIVAKPFEYRANHNPTHHLNNNNYYYYYCGSAKT